MEFIGTDNLREKRPLTIVESFWTYDLLTNVVEDKDHFGLEVARVINDQNALKDL